MIQTLNHHAPAHHHAHLWFAATGLIVVSAFVVMGMLAIRMYQLKQSPATSSVHQGAALIPSSTPVLPEEPRTRTKQITQELKAANLAELKSSTREMQSILNAF